MRSSLWLLLVMLLTGVGVSAGTVHYDVMPLGGDSYQYTYFLSGLTFQVSEQLDVQFDPVLYGALSNGVAPGGFSVTLLDPNNPPGLHGDYGALALINNPSIAGEFSVQFVYLGRGVPGPQPVFLNQFNSDGFFESATYLGLTSGVQSSHSPEPSTAFLTGFTLLFGTLCSIRLWRVKNRQA